MSEPGDPPVTDPEGTPGAAAESAAPQADVRTFLIADIRGYTTYTRENGDEAAAALVNRFAAIVAEIAAARDGFLLEMRGDEALVAFVSARKALRAAVDLQARFAEEKLPRGVGIGLDAGEAIPVGDGYRGTSLNLAARLCAQAAAGETLASEAVMHLAAKIDGIAYVDARDLKLRGYTQSVRAVVVLPTDRAKGHRLATDRQQLGRSRAAVGLVSMAALAVIAVLVGSLVLNGQPRPTPTPAPTSLANASPSVPPTPTSSPDLLGSDQAPVLAFYDAATGKLKGTTSVAPPRNISAFAGGSFWILTEDRGVTQFQQVDPLTNTIARPITVPGVEPHGFAFDDDYIWITDLGSPQVYRIDQRTGAWTTIPFGDESDMTPAGDVSVGDGSVWLSRDQHDPRQITRIDRVTGAIQAQIPVEVFGLTYGADALWYWHDGFIGRIDPSTNSPSFDEVQLSPDEYVGNIYIAGGDAWTDSTGTGKVYRVDSLGRSKSYDLEPGVADMAPAADAMWVTNFDTGELTGIDFATGQKDRVIRTGHAVTAVASNGDEVMVAVGPTADEVIAKLPGSTLTMAANGIPWWDPAPDPPLAGDWQVQQLLYLSCANLVTHPDAPGSEGLSLKPEVAAGMPSVSADGRTYTFTIKPGFKFSPPSNEAVTAETFRYSIERALSPLFEDGAPGPNTFGDIEGAQEYRAGTASTVTGLVVTPDNQLQITLVAAAPDFLDRLASSTACPVPLRGTQPLRSGLKPYPPVSGAGPYYLAQMLPRRLVVYKKNPNYAGDRPQPFDNIAIHNQVAPDVALGRVESGQLDAVMFDPGDTLSGAQSDLAAEWGPNGPHAAAGGQRWFGAARSWVNYISLNPTGPVLRDPVIRHAVALAIDRAELAGVFVEQATQDLIIPTVQGANPAPVAPQPDLDGARQLLGNKPVKVTMLGIPDEWGWDDGAAIEKALINELAKVGITVDVQKGNPDDFFGHGVLDEGSKTDIVWNRATGVDYSDPVASLRDLTDVAWLGKTNLDEMARLNTLTGQDRIDGAVAFADRLVDKDYLIVPFSSPLYPFFTSARVGCGFIQPALGAVDLLSLCIKSDPNVSGSP